MKKFYFVAIAMLAMLMAACSKDGGTLTPVTEKIQGPLGQYFEVVSKEYKLDDTWKIRVEIKRIQEGFPAPWEEGMEVGYSDGYMEPQFTIEFQDADGNIVHKDQSDIVFSVDDLVAIAALGVGETASIKFQAQGKDITQFKMGSSFKCHETSDDSYSDSASSDDEDSSYSDDDDTDSYSSSGSQDWDALLDSYEEYVDKYISYVKKAAKGDMSALSEYPALMEKAQEFSEKMQNAQGDMSSSQWSRYMRITNKMTQAAANM